ncbi:helix-turn-helix domain-containing protein [Ligilactobacillus salivarius]|uniref:helix-turn-helix domain-containing protein n=1 Tax=Ligilactobacillus salivarius TaxID=1624 RepID=UPI0034DB0CBE
MTTFKKLKYDSNLKPSNRLRELRLSKNLTLKQVADDIGISENLIGKYEREEREPKLKTWIKLADYFNVSVSYLQGLTGFSKGKAPSDDLDINYLHQRINRMLEINNIHDLQNELENVIKITHLMQK